MFDIAAGYDGKRCSCRGEASASPASPIATQTKAGEADETCFAPTIKIFRVSLLDLTANLAVRVGISMDIDIGLARLDKLHQSAN